eukprot:TRINITY_DN2633_c0_g1_i2.p1 TRINITY_DN2633_c0_g1~~TRINITY_DN2633_c0_g1_i2.p1  ORF type:complete len:1926 (+),score=1092.00 TRINITY_DN2633_c0_g1_i2:39-5780(+)
MARYSVSNMGKPILFLIYLFICFTTVVSESSIPDSLSILQQELSDAILEMQTIGEPENLDEVLNDLISQLQRQQMPSGEPLELSWDTIGDITVSPKSVCFVVSSFEGIYLNSGIGTAYYGLAELLARNGHNVTVLYTRDTPASTGSFNDWVERYQQDNINLKFLPPSLTRITNPKLQTVSYLVFNYLKSASFDIVHFADFEGLGYYSTLAKRIGHAFESTTLIAGLHGPTSWILQANTGRNPAHESELEVDYMERHSVENADYVWTPSSYLASWLSLQGWNISANIELLPLPPGPGIKQAANTEAIKARELVFFGRLEKRKGLILFCDAIDILAKMSSVLPADFSVSFLGSSGFVDGMDSIQYVKTRSASWPFPAKVITEFTRDAALEYLSEEGANRLPVIPSLVDNAPYTVFECLYANIPFLASATPSIVPLLANAANQNAQLFETKPHHLASRMINSLKTGVSPAVPVFTADRAEQAWMSFYHRVAAAQPVVSATPVDTPLVSVCITYFNRPALVRQALQSIESQDYQNYEIILVDDGSNDTAAIRYLESIEPYFAQKNWKIIRTTNRYLGAARNTAAQSASGKYLLFLDDDNVAYANQLSTYVKVAEKTKSNIVTAAHSVFRGVNPPTEDKIEKLWVPLGDSLSVGLFKNCFGDANFFVEKESFVALGGFTEEYGVGLEEHEFFAKAIFAGYKLTVVPEPLLYYRMHDENNQMIFTTDIRQGEARRMRPYIQAMTTEQVEADAESARARRSVVTLVARNAVRDNTDCNATVVAIDPSQGPISGGTYVTIRGSGFNCNVQAVLIGEKPCTGVHVVSDTELTCTTPPGDASYAAVDVAVTIAGNTVVLYSHYIYTPLGAPQLQSAVVADNGLSFDLTFSVATNKESCTGLFSAAAIATLGDGWACVWSTPSSVKVTFGTGATLNIGDSVTVLANTVTSLGQGGIANEETTVALAAPVNPLKPVAFISVPSTIPSCDGATLDASSSSGSAGRTLTFSWKLDSVEPANTNSPVSGLLTAATSGSVALSADDVAVDSKYTVSVTVTNWLSQTASSTAVFTKSSAAVPVVTIAGPAVVQIKVNAVLALSGSVTASCGSNIEGSVTYAWSFSPAITVDASLLSSASLSLPAGSLAAQTDYVATLTATTAAGASNSADVKVVVGISDLIAQIVGGNQQYGETQTVSLDASSSSDPDNLGALSFSWSCSKFNEPATPCPEITLTPTASLSLVASAVGVGKWTFTVTVSGTNDRTATASAWVEVTEAVVVSVAIAAVQSPVNPGLSLTLVGSLNSASIAASDVAWSWSLISGSIADPATAYSAGTTSSSLVIAANVLAPGSQYEYKLLATHTSGATGYATVTFTVASAPSLGFTCGALNGNPEYTVFDYAFTSTSGVNFLLAFTPSGESLRVPLSELSTTSTISTKLPAGTYTLVGSTYDASNVATSKNCAVTLSFADASSAIAGLVTSAQSGSVFDLAHIAFSAKTAYNAVASKPDLSTLFAEILSGVQSSTSSSAQGVVAATYAIYIVSDASLIHHTEADITSLMTVFSELLDKQAGTTDTALISVDLAILSSIFAQIDAVNGNNAKRSVEAADTAALYDTAIALVDKFSALAGGILADGQSAFDLSSDNVDITIYRQAASSVDTSGVSVGSSDKFTLAAGVVPASVSSTNSLLFVFSRFAKSSYAAPSGMSFASRLETVRITESGSAVSFEAFDPAAEIYTPSSKLSTSDNLKCMSYVNNSWTDAGASASSDKSGITCAYSQPAAAYAVMSSAADGAVAPGKSDGLAGKYIAAIVAGGVGAIAAVALTAFGVRKYRNRAPRVAQPAADPAAGAQGPAPADATAVSVDPAVVAAAGSAPSGLSSYSSRSYSSSYASSSSSSEEEIMEAEIKNIVGELTQALPKDARALEVLGDKLEME